MNESEVRKIVKRDRETAKRGLSQQYENTESCWSFYNADQMTYSDRIQFEDTWGRKRRAMVNFNKIQQNVDAVVGFMAQNRRQAKYIAHLNADQGQVLYSKNMNSLYTFHREHQNADQLESDQDLDMMVNGYGAIDTDLSYIIGNATTMPNGEIIKEHLDPTCVYWDPSAKGKNNLDAKYCGYWKDFDLQEALKLFQGSKTDDFEASAEEEPGDFGFVFNPYGGIYSKIKLDNTVEWTSKEQEKVRVYNHQWYEFETFYKAANPLYTVEDPMDALYMKARMDVIKSEIKYPGDTQTEDMFEFDPTAEILVFDEATKRVLVREFGDLLEPVDFKRRVYYTAVTSGEHIFTWFKSISQTGFSIKFKTGTWNRGRKIWMGMVNPMMEPQKYYNKALTELMFTIAANSKGGVYVEEDAVEDIADFETKYAKTDGVIKVASGALAAGKIQDKARPAVPTGLENIIQLSDANISANGVDPSFWGDIQKEDQSGILFKRRIRQVISKMARYFDSIELYQEEDARLHADLIPIWVENNNGEWMRITGPDGAEEFVQITEDMLAPAYDVTIQEAAQTPEDKQETSILLAGYGDKLMAVGDPAGKVFMAESLQFLPTLDGDTRNRLIQTLQPQQQIDPAQMQALQAEYEKLKAYIEAGEVEKTKSEIEYNLARAEQMRQNAAVTQAKIPSTQAETPLKQAQTVKTLQEAERTAVESAIAATMPDDDVQVNL